MTSQAVSETQTGTADDTVTRLMKRYKIPMTRENYLGLAYGDQRPEWGAELEASLPPQLQDWSQFK